MERGLREHPTIQDSEGEVVTGADEDNNSLTSDTNLESLSTDDTRGKVCNLQSLCTLQLKFVSDSHIE